MSERLTDEPAIDRKDYPGALIYVDKEGYVCKADPGANKLSDEEKAARAKARADKRAKVTAERATFRLKMREAKKAARKDPSVANAQRLEATREEYEKIMGR